MNYSSISDFGPNTYSPVDNPLTYCMGNDMEQRFLHGGHADTMGQNSKQCQLFMSEYCSEKWDSFCEIASRSKDISYPNNRSNCMSGSCSGSLGVTGGVYAGDSLIYNTAERKYLVKMHGATKKYQPFDPTVANSPMISYWVNNHYSHGSGIPEYSVDPKTIDSDVVMDKILAKPLIAMNILINIYNTMKRKQTLSGLQGTKLGYFYTHQPYFKSKGGL